MALIHPNAPALAPASEAGTGSPAISYAPMRPNVPATTPGSVAQGIMAATAPALSEGHD